MADIPTIEPFQFIRSTAFSERVQLANKLNEVIDAVNSIGDLPDLESQITEINTKISELEESIGNTDTSLAELENQVNDLISEVNTTIKQSISALESEVEGIDTRLTTAEGTISEHGTEIDGLLKEVIDGVAMMSNPHGTIQVQINHEDGSNDISAPIDLGLVEQGGIVLQSGTTDRSFKLIVTLTDGTSWQTNDFVIPEGGGTDVSVTNISIAQGTESNMIQVKIGLSDGSAISSNDWTVVTPSEFSALGTRVSTAEGKITAQEGEISDLETRVQAIEDSPGFTLQPATATRLGGVKIGSGITVQADGTISVNLSPYALKSEIPDVSQFVTAEDVAAEYQPKGDYLTEIPIGGTAIGGVKNGGNVTINADGTMKVTTGGGPKLKTSGDINDIITISGDTITIAKNFIIEYIYNDSEFLDMTGNQKIITTSVFVGKSNIIKGSTGKWSNAHLTIGKVMGIYGQGSRYPYVCITLNDAMNGFMVGFFLDNGTTINPTSGFEPLTSENDVVFGSGANNYGWYRIYTFD